MSAQKPSNRREAMRARQAAEAKKRRRNRLLIVVAIVVVVALIVAGVVWLLNRKPSTPLGTETPTTSQLTPPDGDAQRAWITVPSANPNTNALIVDVHFDYQCPYCERAETAYAVLLEQLNDQGDITLRHHTRTILNGVNYQTVAMSTNAAVAAACVDVADNTKYAAYNNTLFANQPKTEGPGFSDQQLTQDFPATVGLTGEALAKFQQCYANQSTLKWVQDVEANNIAPVPNTAGFPAYLFGGMTPLSDTNGRCTGTTGADVGVCGTPSFFVQGVQFTLSDIFNGDWTPKFTTASDLLAFLQQTAKS